jgi:hypothetical protein
MTPEAHATSPFGADHHGAGAGRTRREPSYETPSSSVTIDCDRCTLRGIGCGDCVVTVLLGGPPFGVPLDDAERRAIDVLADAGLVPPLRMVEAVEAQYDDSDRP